jgi:tetratricopeptide (TPR) repeat protein
VAVVGAGLGDCFTEAEVAQVAQRLPPQLGFDGLDPRSVLARLVGLGVLRRDGESLGFARVSTSAGLLASAPPALVTAVHTAVVDASGDWVGETHHRRRARALMALGRTDEAWHNARWLGETALGRYQDVEAEEWLTQALAGCPAEAQVALLRARAKSRRRRQDFGLALEDLDGALLRSTSSAERLSIDLERATCFDWLERYDRSVAIGTEVEAQLAAGRLALTPGVQLAVGRTALRRGDWQRALEFLEPVWQADDDELAVVAGALGGAALSALDRLEQAEAVFAHAEARALAADDVVHLGVTLSNRVFLHLKRHDVAFAMRDLERATSLARRAGHATIERWCSHNLAQFHLWGGRPTLALPFARRAHLLAVRFFAPAPPVSSTLLLAGALAALSQFGEAGAVLAQLEPLRGGFSAADRAGWLTVTTLLGRRCTDEDIAFLRDAPELQPDQRYDSLRAAARLRPDIADIEARARGEATPGLFREL